MSRLELSEGSVDEARCDAVLRLEPAVHGDEASLRVALSDALAGAARAGARRVALAPDALALGFATQRCAEVLIELARAEEGGVEEVQIVLDGEPTYRIYEAVYDAARIAEQMSRLRE